MSAAGVAAAGAGSLIGGLLTTAANITNEWQNRGWKSQKEYEDYRADYEKEINDYFLNKQMGYNTEMANTAYQRAIIDMEAAGINPASLAGVSAQAAYSPTASAPSSSMHTNAHMMSQPFQNVMDSFMSSAVNYMISKDNNAARLLAAEIIDNAKHAHILEEKGEDLAQMRLDQQIAKWSKFKK